MEILEKLNAILGKKGLKAVPAEGSVKLEAAPAPAPLELKASGKLADGSEIATPADGFTVGSEVYVMDAEGNQVPAPDGEHVIDGSLEITVSGGVITEAETVEIEEEAGKNYEDKPKEEQMSAEIEAVINALTTRIGELEAKIGASEANLADVKAKLAAAESKVVELGKAAGAASVTEPARPAAPQKEGKLKLSAQLSKQSDYISRIAQIHASKSN